jgi:Rrf2 family protein
MLQPRAAPGSAGEGCGLRDGPTILSRTAEYALRAVSLLAAQPPDSPLRARDLSRETDIPAHYLAKILRRLVVSGILTSQRGQGGGFVLARPPEAVRFLDVLAAVGAEPDPGRCAFGWGACDASAPCPLHTAWRPIGEAFLQWAATTTLAAAAGAKERPWRRPSPPRRPGLPPPA